MALPKKTTFKDITLAESTTSIATTPVASVFIAPCAGTIIKVSAGAAGITTGTIAVAVTVNGGADVSGGLLTVPAGTNSRTSLDLAKNGASAVVVAEGDLITFTPSGG